MKSTNACSKRKDDFKNYPCNGLIFCTVSDEAGTFLSLPILNHNSNYTAIIFTVSPPNHYNP
jgi:hypothetical protein